MRYIFSSFIISGVTSEGLSNKFEDSFKDSLTVEIKKYQSTGLESIEVKSSNTNNGNSLIIEFVALVNPDYHQEIRSAVGRALLTLDVSL